MAAMASALQLAVLLFSFSTLPQSCLAQVCPATVWSGTQPGLRSPAFCAEPCEPLAVPEGGECMYDASACVGLQPGDSCEVVCIPPYMRVNGSGNVTCPIGDVIGPAGLTWPASLECALEISPCIAQPETCLPPTPCELPTVNTCRYYLVGCSGIMPGESCQIRCRSPYSGGRGIAYCPSDKRRPDQQLIVQEPDCSLDCEEPEEPPEGYIKIDGQWQCAPGYVGTAVARCTTDLACFPVFIAEGCERMVPCKVPDTSCTVDFSDCRDLQPGATCQVQCWAPYEGQPTQGFCDAFNTDPDRELWWEAPDCHLNCVAAFHMQVNYTSHPYVLTGLPNQWSCYRGFAAGPEGIIFECGMNDETCDLWYKLRGCYPLQSCSAPDISSLPDQCMYSMTPCLSVTAGTTCQVKCREPHYVGPSAQAICNGTNIVDQHPAEWVQTEPCTRQCPVPAEFPPGFAGTLEGLECAPGYTGNATATCVVDANCISFYLFEGCSLLKGCSEPVVGPMDMCKYDFSDCTYVPAGSTCTVPCGRNHLGPTVTAECDELNDDDATPVIWSPQACEPDCVLSADALPPGYVQDEFICGAGYTGYLEWSCIPTEDCSGLELNLSGCMELQPCGVPVLDGVDMCLYNLSDCENISAGSTCMVTCNEPFEGDPTIAVCPENNMDANSEVLWHPPRCRAECEDPENTTNGYERTPCSYVCASGYAGLAIATCEPRPPSCVAELELTGCVLEMPCVLPEEILNITCGQWNISECDHLEPGASCEVPCAYPYTGVAGEMVCPTGNTNLAQEPIWVKQPSCEVVCDDPVSAPIGFGGSSKGGWRCAAGYFGSPASQCVVEAVYSDTDSSNETGDDDSEPDVECVPRMELSGCKLIVPCAPITVPADPQHSCRLDVADCAAVPAGGSCQIGCLLPYFGNVEDGFCPVNNTDPTREVSFTEPVCNLACGRPEPPRIGYSIVADVWQCANGYTGEAEEICEMIEGCLARPALTGCSKIMPCLLPELTEEDACRIDISQCVDITAGQACTVSCKAGYTGGGVPAECPEFNIDPLQELAAFCFPGSICVPPNPVGLPTCTCLDPDPIPEGYSRDLVAGTWSCAPGWEGIVEVECTTELSDCSGYMNLTGCSELESCSIDYGLRQECIINSTDWDPMPGDEVEVSCMAPFEGNAGSGQCPDGNIMIGRPVEWSQQPTCKAHCGPDTRLMLPDGYVNAAWDDITCGRGYRGSPTAECTIDPDSCDAVVVVEGCVELQPCRVPTEDPCRFDFSSCQGIGPGGTCLVQCRAPFMGSATAAYCHPSNTDPMQFIQWTPPDCWVPDCEEPASLPQGYEREGCGWKCAEGFVGQAASRCGARPEEGCSIKLQLHGCTPEEYCEFPEEALTNCSTDWSDCSEVLLGNACEVRCKTPFVGQAVQVVCPSSPPPPSSMGSNDSLSQNPTFPLPDIQCVAANALCPMPSTFPLGYRLIGNTVRCAPGFTGDVTTTCVQTNEPGCVFHQNYSGCVPTTPCRLPAVFDSCMHNMSACTNLLAGESCPITCRPPYTQTTIGRGVCPAENIDPDFEMTIDAPVCDLACGAITEVPVGYFFGVSRWLCENGFIGFAEVTCSTVLPASAGTVNQSNSSQGGAVALPEHDDCLVETALVGCSRFVRCTMPALNPCIFEAFDCETLRPGQTCDILCNDPYVGDTFSAACVDDNNIVQPDAYLVSPPTCRCPTPTTIPAGYEQQPDGEWRCAAGYTGAAVANCTSLSDCSPQLLLTGCELMSPCRGPDLTQFAVTPGQCSSIDPGVVCDASCVSSACVSGGPIRFECPAGNTDPDREPTLLVDSSEPCVNDCAVCTIASFTDTDGRRGFVGGKVLFGAVHLNGTLGDPAIDVTRFSVFFSTACGNQMGAAIATAVRTSQNIPTESCCRVGGSYEAVVEEVAIPSGATHILIAMEASTGMLPGGQIAVLEDYVLNNTVVYPQRGRLVSPMSGCERHALGSTLSLALIVHWALVACLPLSDRTRADE